MNSNNYLNDEFNNSNVEEIIQNKDFSHETGEYNELQIYRGVVKSSKEESSSSKEENVKKTISIGSSIGIVGAVGGVIIGTVILSSSLTFLWKESIIGISQATCFFELRNLKYDEITISLEDDKGTKIQEADLSKTDINNQYYVFFDNLSPNTTYHLSGINEDGKSIKLGNYTDFTTLAVPTYNFDLDMSDYDKEAGKYNLSFTIDNKTESMIDAFLFCDNDSTYYTRISSTDGYFEFTLPTILSSYRIELYQEGYLVGQKFFSDYSPMTLAENEIDIGIHYANLGFNLGDITTDIIDISVTQVDDPLQLIDVGFGEDSNKLYVNCDANLTPNTKYLVEIKDKNRPSLIYYSYQFQTIDIPSYEITIDDSNFNLNNRQYDLIFNLDNPNNYIIDAYLHCLNDSSLDETYMFYDNSLEITLPTPYSEYQLFLTQEGHEVGTIQFEYYQPIQVINDSTTITVSSFSASLDLGDVPLENLTAWMVLSDVGTETPLELILGTDSKTVDVTAQGLTSGMMYSLRLKDKDRPSLIYLDYLFVTPS